MSDFLDVAARSLAREMTTWSSIDLSVREEGRHVIPRKNQPTTFSNAHHYIETQKGQRMIDSVFGSEGKKMSHVSAYDDGARCARVVFLGASKQHSLLISRSFLNEGGTGSTDRPPPLQFFYVGKVPIYEALSRSTYLGKGEILGKSTEIILFPRVKWGMTVQDLVYDLDKQTCIPLRIRFFVDTIDKNTFSTVTPAWEWRAQTLDEVQGFHMPLRSESLQYDTVTSATRTTRQFSIESIKYNASHPASTFWPVPQPGVQVIDSIKKSSFVVPPRKAETSTLTETKTEQRPIQALPPYDWGVGISSVSLIVGVVAVGVGFYIRCHRR
jgi:hypothetical protein